MRRAWVAAMAGAVLSGWCSAAWAATIQVPTAAHRTIQSAIDAAVPGDEVVVSPGFYDENLSLGGKDIVLRSTDPENISVVSSTIVSGGRRQVAVVTLSGAETAACVLDGLTITGGGIIPNLEATVFDDVQLHIGGGIAANRSRATIRRCHIVGNSALSGGGISEAAGLIDGCLIAGNYASSNVAGVSFIGSTIRDSVISHNTVYFQYAVFLKLGIGGGGSGGVSGAPRTAEDGTTLLYPVIENSAVTDNRVVMEVFTLATGGAGTQLSPRGGGGYIIGTVRGCLVGRNRIIGKLGGPLEDQRGQNLFVEGEVVGSIVFSGNALIGRNPRHNTFHDCRHVDVGYGEIRNNIFSSVQYFSVFYDPFTFSHNLLDSPPDPRWAAMPGVITGDPRFVDAENGDFRLAMDSPAIDAGMALEGFDTDIEGAPRPVKSITWEERGDGSGTDIGAHEFQLPLLVLDAIPGRLMGTLPPLTGQDGNGDGVVDIADFIRRERSARNAILRMAR